jgi:polysaccharide biosynthesis/export protein
MTGWRSSALGGLLCLFATAASASEATVAAPPPTAAPAAAAVATDPEHYLLQPGDVLIISVWKEKDLDTPEVLVRPDGGLSFPLVGDIDAAGHTIEEVRQTLTKRLKPFIPDPVVTVLIKGIGGNHVYVLGKVNRPGEFPFSRRVDVMQALSLAGGTTPFAALNDIVILRRQNGEERVLRFRYGDIERGKNLEQNVVLESGDTVVVP